jgi:hypothetical protein
MTWTESIATKECARDRLRLGDLFGEAFAIGATLLVALFFIANQLQETGLFTSDFGNLEMVLFYVPMLFGLVPPFVRLVTGRRNLARPFEVAGSILFMLGASYLLAVWPFDVTHLADLLPQSLRFLLDWITNDLAQLLTAFAIFITLLVSIWTFFLYISVRERLGRGPSP